MKKLYLFVLNLLVAPLLFGAYADKPENNVDQHQQQALSVDSLKSATNNFYSDDIYPYYANTPEDLIPFKDVEPVFRYWTKRLPFR
ncbi:MAG: hypothetical protein ACPMAG_05490, partial [Limisphaerales bacterium]